MKKKLFPTLILLFILLLLLPSPFGQDTLLTVFRTTEKPAVIVRGMSGSTITVNISFGDEEVEQWIRELEPPYPLLFIDMEWATRFPNTITLLKEKNIPTGLLGHTGASYEHNLALFVEQVKAYETLFQKRPLWFRTKDEMFPQTLQAALWEMEVNALGSTTRWQGGDAPPILEGEIISISHHRDVRIDLTEIQQLSKERNMISIEEMLFTPVIEKKKIPK